MAIKFIISKSLSIVGASRKNGEREPNDFYPTPKKVITKFGKINSYYVLIAKPPIFEIPFRSQEIELKKLIS